MTNKDIEPTELELAISEALNEASKDPQTIYKNTKKLYKLISALQQQHEAEVEEWRSAVKVLDDEVYIDYDKLKRLSVPTNQ